MMRVFVVDPSNFTVPYDNALCDGLVGQGHDVHLYCRAARQSETVPNGVFQTHYSFFHHAEKMLASRVPTSVAQVAKAWELHTGLKSMTLCAKDMTPDIIHFQWMTLPLVEHRWIRSLRQQLPVVLTVHDTQPFLGAPSGRLQTVGWHRLLRRFDHLICHTQTSATTLQQYGIAARRITIIPHPPIANLRFDLAIPTRKPNQRVRILLFGHLKRYKGADILLRAVARLHEDVQDRISVTIAGKPYPETQDLPQLISSLKLQHHVSYKPQFLSDEDLARTICDHDVLVFPYRTIDASGALLSVAQADKAIIATRVGVFSEAIIDGHNGLLIDPESVEQLSTAIASIVTDDELRSRLSKNSWSTSNRFGTWESAAISTANVYRSMLADRFRPVGASQ